MGLGSVKSQKYYVKQEVELMVTVAMNFPMLSLAL
ncbi:MAG: hypothetical protein JWR12_2170 [Mucilaginibacter sp.]|nr:hypothetical protein [Mucilaginibacter sp.]